MILFVACSLLALTSNAGDDHATMPVTTSNSLPDTSNQSQIVRLKLGDGNSVSAKLDLPTGVESCRTLVIFVHGTGPNTYLNRRKMGSAEFNFFDFYSQEFTRRGVGFLAYNRRGVELGDSPPSFETIDREKFRTGVPKTEANDLATMIRQLKQNKRLSSANIVLLGWSEGTIIAPMAAELKANGVDALFLAGYVNENMFDVIEWQFSGASSMMTVGGYFDKNADNRISQSEYESNDATATGVRKTGFKDKPFAEIDLNKDGFISSQDFKILNDPKFQELMRAYAKKDEEWIWKNYFHVSIPWLREHFALEANKTRLLRLNLPITIFHGTKDLNCDVAGVHDIKRRFELAGKTNLTIRIFEGHGHDLNYSDFLTKKQISPGNAEIFEAAAKLPAKK